MTKSVATDLVEVIIAESWLSNVDDLIAARRNPAGRNPGSRSLELAEIWGRLSDEDARCLAADLVDSTISSLLSLIDQDFKNSGLHARFYMDGCADGLDSRAMGGGLTETYRAAVNPHGVLRPIESEGGRGTP